MKRRKSASPAGGESSSSLAHVCLRFAAYGLIALLVGLAGFALLWEIGGDLQEERLSEAITA